MVTKNGTNYRLELVLASLVLVIVATIAVTVLAEKWEAEFQEDLALHEETYDLYCVRDRENHKLEKE